MTQPRCVMTLTQGLSQGQSTSENLSVLCVQIDSGLYLRHATSTFDLDDASVSSLMVVNIIEVTVHTAKFS